MNNKITKARIKDFLLYALLKTVAITVLICVFLIIVFDIVSVKPSNGQNFIVLVGNDVICGEESDEVLYKTTTNDVQNFGFSYDVLEISSSTLISEAPHQEMVTKREIHEDDIFIATSYLAGEYISTLSAISFDDYLKKANAYINKFLDENGNVDENIVKSNFYKTRGKDNRFRNSKNKNLGIKEEIKRIKGLLKNIRTLERVFSENKQIFASEFLDVDIDKGQNTYGYAIDLSKLTGKEGKNIKNAFMVMQTSQDSEEVVYTAEGVYLMVGSNSDSDGDLFFEPMAYILNLIDTYTNFI